MAVLVRIPTPLRSLTKGQAEVEVAANTVAGLIEDLEKQYPGPGAGTRRGAASSASTNERTSASSREPRRRSRPATNHRPAIAGWSSRRAHRR
jgi:molybdopterin converting factor small subunit